MLQIGKLFNILPWRSKLKQRDDEASQRTEGSELERRSWDAPRAQASLARGGPRPFGPPHGGHGHGRLRRAGLREALGRLGMANRKCTFRRVSFSALNPG